jgi:hypothetical protein
LRCLKRALATAKPGVKDLAAGAGRNSSRLQVEAEISSVQSDDEPIEDFAEAAVEGWHGQAANSGDGTS